MRQKILFVFMMTVITLSAALAQGESAVYVQSAKAKVMSAPSFKANVLGETSRGSKLSSLGRTGSWVKVSYGSKEGYISALLVSSSPPMAKQGLINDKDSEISNGVRRRASTFTSAAAARGLTHEDRKRSSTEEEVDYRAVTKMESLTMSADEVTKFAEGGRP